MFALSWLKNNVTMVLVAALAVTIILWRGAADDAREAKETVRSYQRVLLAQDNINQQAQRVDAVTVRVVQDTMETPNANVLVPPDVAAAWLNGIERVRDAARADGATAELPRSGSSDAGAKPKRNHSGRANGSDFSTARSSLPKMQLSSRTSLKPHE